MATPFLLALGLPPLLLGCYQWAAVWRALRHNLRVGRIACAVHTLVYGANMAPAVVFVALVVGLSSKVFGFARYDRIMTPCSPNESFPAWT